MRKGKKEGKERDVEEVKEREKAKSLFGYPYRYIYECVV